MTATTTIQPVPVYQTQAQHQVEDEDDVSLSSSASTSFSATPGSSATSPRIAPAHNPSEAEQRRYQVRGAFLLATNMTQAFAPYEIDPITRWSSRRITTGCDHLDFARYWQANILEDVAEYLSSTHGL